MFNVLVYLLAIQQYAKGIHYHCKGDSFYSDHLLADRIYDGIDDFIDQIQESYYLGKGDETPQPQELLYEASNIIPDISGSVSDDFLKLADLIGYCAEELNKVSKAETTTIGDSDLIGRIFNDLQTKHGFIYQRLKS